MGQPTQTFDAYDAVGVREDLHDKIYMVSPESTPVLSAIKRLKASQKLHEWQRDALGTPNKDNAVIEGDERSGSALTATQRVANVTQLMDYVAVVSSTAEKSKAAGRSSEMKYQIAKKMKELKRDVEAMILSDNVAVQGDNATARKSAGLSRLLSTNTSLGVNGVVPAHTTGLATTAITDGTDRAFAETQLKSVMQSIYTNSGEMPTIVSMTPSHKGGFSAFTGIAGSRYQVKKGQQAVIVGGADVYMSDFGELTVVPNYVQTAANPASVFILNPETLGVAYLQPFQSTPLAKTGHTEKELVFVECTLVVESEKANGQIKDLTA